jgi:hypothetical protein
VNLRERLIEHLLTEGMDGDFLVGCGRSVGNEDGDVALSEARPSEVAAWAVDNLAERMLTEVLHSLWLAIHVRRFDTDHPEDGRPLQHVDTFYAGTTRAERIVTEYGRDHGVPRVYDCPVPWEDHWQPSEGGPHDGP